MMEETQTIFAVGAGAVTKLVSEKSENGNPPRIVRIFTPKYPYEYLREFELRAKGELQEKKSIFDQIDEFFLEEKN